ncbi:MAG: hypothetical protein ACX930_06100 [Erythrobacter sp.]
MFIQILDLALVAIALAASLLWLRSSRRRVRRICRHEAFDQADYNRLVTALNRAHIPHSLAALATGIVTGPAAVRLLLVELGQ